MKLQTLSLFVIAGTLVSNASYANTVSQSTASIIYNKMFASVTETAGTAANSHNKKGNLQCFDHGAQESPRYYCGTQDEAPTLHKGTAKELYVVAAKNFGTNNDSGVAEKDFEASCTQYVTFHAGSSTPTAYYECKFSDLMAEQTETN